MRVVSGTNRVLVTMGASVDLGRIVGIRNWINRALRWFGLQGRDIPPA